MILQMAGRSVDVYNLPLDETLVGTDCCVRLLSRDPLRPCLSQFRALQAYTVSVVRSELLRLSEP